MNDAFAAKNVRRFAEIIADVGLLPDPIEEVPFIIKTMPLAHSQSTNDNFA
jgi:hypothetical protein